jgi:hypothetical protein
MPRARMSSRFSFMMRVDLTSSPLMPMASACCSTAASICLDRHLDAEVDDAVAIVGENDVNEVLSDVMHVPLDRGEHDGAFA